MRPAILLLGLLLLLPAASAVGPGDLDAVEVLDPTQNPCRPTCNDGGEEAEPCEPDCGPPQNACRPMCLLLLVEPSLDETGAAAAVLVPCEPGCGPPSRPCRPMCLLPLADPLPDGTASVTGIDPGGNPCRPTCLTLASVPIFPAAGVRLGCLAAAAEGDPGCRPPPRPCRPMCVAILVDPGCGPALEVCTPAILSDPILVPEVPSLPGSIVLDPGGPCRPSCLALVSGDPPECWPGCIALLAIGLGEDCPVDPSKCAVAVRAGCLEAHQCDVLGVEVAGVALVTEPDECPEDVTRCQVGVQFVAVSWPPPCDKHCAILA